MKSVQQQMDIRGKKLKDTSDLVLRRAQARIAQQIYGGLTLLLVGLMWFNSQTNIFAGNNNKVDTNINVTAGVLELMNVEASLRFADITAGVGGTASNQLDNTVVKDYRGGANQYWSLRLNSSNMNTAGDANTIHAYNITVTTGSATKINITTFNNAGTSVGNGEASTEATLNTIRNIFNSTYNSSGVLGLNDIVLNVTVPSTHPAGVYAGGLLLSAIATDGT